MSRPSSPLPCWLARASSSAAGSLAPGPPASNLASCRSWTVARIRLRHDRSRHGLHPHPSSAPVYLRHLTQERPHRRVNSTLSRSALRSRPYAQAVTTTAPADFSLRLDIVALSGKGRDLPRQSVLLPRPPADKSSAEARHLVLLGSASPSARDFAPRFLSTVGRPASVALRFALCDQLAARLASARERPSWAYEKGPRTGRGPFASILGHPPPAPP